MSFFERFGKKNSTSLNVDTVNKYSFNYSAWASGLQGPVGMVVYGSHMYVANYSSGTISQISLADGSITNPTWSTGFSGPFGLAIDDTYMYVSNNVFGEDIGNTISKVSLSNGSVIDLNWATGLNGPTGLVVHGLYLYVANFGQAIGGTTISQISLLNGDITNIDWATGLIAPFDLLINGSYMYVSNFSLGPNSGTISQINLADGTMINADWSTGFSLPAGLAVYKSHMYVADYDLGRISQVNLADGSIAKSNWASGFVDQPFFIITYDTYLYISFINNTIIVRIALENKPKPISNICFKSNTPIQTDQGIVVIDKIDTCKHTINNKQIVYITKTITTDKYLICFKKNALGLNYPTDTTIMSRNHKINYHGKMIEAYKFIGHFENVYKVKYDGETLYNILMDEHSEINVNNIICETLHPKNIVAKIYNSNFGEEYKNNIIVMMNECISKNDYSTYKKLVNHI
jgi:hypothetical protein